jgi:hypothetical protein
MSLLLAEPPISTERIDVSEDDIVTAVFIAEEANSLWKMAFDWSDQQDGTIRDLEDGYQVLRPIPYRIVRQENGEFLAQFTEANIAITGTDQHDAYQSLIAEILDTYDVLTSEQQLSPAAAEQMATLRTYLVKA